MATYYNPKIITNNIEFSVDAANIKSWSGPSLVPAGTDYGYFAGGNPSKSIVDRIDFNNDTATASIRGPLTANKSGHTATGSNSYGYFGGGNSSVDRVDYSNDTPTATASGNLSVSRYGAGSTGNNSYGYFAGGDPASSSVDRIDYSNDSAAASPKGPLTATSRYNAAAGNLSYGYVKVGNPAVNSSKVERIDYSNDTATAVEKGPLTSVRYWIAATGNASYGYYGGDGPYAGSTLVDRVDYSNDTATALARGPLAHKQSLNAATGNSSFGYFAAGYINSGRTSQIDRLDYASDTTTAVAKGSLNNALSSLAAASSRENGLPTSSSASILKDMTGKGNNGTVNGATYNSGNGGYFDFDGTNDTVTFPTSSIVLAEEDFTLGFWVFAADASDNWQCIISSTDTTGGSGNNSAGSWQVGPVSSQIRFYVRNDAGSDHFLLQSSSTISDDTWYNIVITRSSGGSYAMYFNGELEATGSDGDGGTDLDCGIVALGINRAYDNYWEGGIATAQIYKGKALTAAEVQQNFNATRSRFGV